MAPQTHLVPLFGFHPSVALVWAVLLLVVGYGASRVIYNLFLSPLSNIPGPKLWALSEIPNARVWLSGQSHKRMLELHQRYGNVVRISPRQVAFQDSRAWKEVMGHRKAGQLENGRDPNFYMLSGQSLIGNISSEEHGRQRRILSHGFSAQSLSEQQPMIQRYVDLLMQRLHENCDAGAKPLDMTKFYNYTTFDVIGDLAFGEPFGCLDNTTYHPWVPLVFQSAKQFGRLTQFRWVWPAADRFLRERGWLGYFMPGRVQHYKLTHAKIAKRMALQEDRPDFMRSMLAKNADGDGVSAVLKLTPQQIATNASTLIIAGSETTATALSGATYLLGASPDVLSKLTDEVRSAFSSEQEITLLSVQKLKYMLAVLDETLRLFPPAPGAQPRVVHEGGEIICDTFLPAGTTVNIGQWAMNRSSKHFYLPDAFIPERWMGDPRFANDNKEASQPFIVGPRNCIGKNLAYAEMRLIMAKLIWNFDLKLANPHEDWINKSESYIIWEKIPLQVHLYPRSK